MDKIVHEYFVHIYGVIEPIDIPDMTSMINYDS